VAVFNAVYYADPPPPPVRPPGLFTAAIGPMPFPSPNAVGGGVQYIPDDCGDVFLWDMQCPPVSGSKTFSALPTIVSGAPFAVYSSYTCSIVGIDYEEARRRTLTKASLFMQEGVERRFWQGSLATPGLPGMTGLLRGSTPLAAASCVTSAIALMEQALADNNIISGVIHARPYMAPFFAARHQLEKNGPGWMTKMGTPIVFGGGYDGTGPNGEAVTATTEYMYVTGRVPIWQDPEIFVNPVEGGLNRSTNVLTLVAEQVYAVGIECGKFSVAVTRDCTLL
jgi:hypothetical protein